MVLYASSRDLNGWQEREIVRPRPRLMKRDKCGLLNSFVPLDILSDCKGQVFVWGTQLRRASETALGRIMPATLRLIREHWIVFTLLGFLLLAAIVYIIAATAYRVAKEQERLTILSLQRECRKWSLEQDMERRIQENENFPASFLSMPLTPPAAGGDEAAVDHALYKAGARVLLSMSSPALEAHQSWLEWLGSLFRDWHEADRYHRLMLEPEMTHGSCFPMAGERGLVTLKLNSSVVVSTVGLDHLSRFISRNITMAPRDFIVYCFDEAFSWARKLGSFRYEIDGEPSQTFRVQRQAPQPCRVIRLWVLNNWGNKEKTCVYRFRVHGRIRQPECTAHPGHSIFSEQCRSQSNNDGLFKRKSYSSRGSPEQAVAAGESSILSPDVKRVEQHHYHYWGDLNLNTKIKGRVNDLTIPTLDRPITSQMRTRSGERSQTEPRNKVLLLLLLMAGIWVLIQWHEAPVDKSRDPAGQTHAPQCAGSGPRTRFLQEAFKKSVNMQRKVLKDRLRLLQPQYSALQKAIQTYRLLITDLRAQGAFLRAQQAEQWAEKAGFKAYHAKQAALEAQLEDLRVAQRLREAQLMKQPPGVCSCQDAVLKPDFALKSIGGRVVAHSASYESGTSSFCIYWVCWRYSQPADVMLQPDNTPGNCWALRGPRGYAVLKLAHRIRPTALTVDHISQLISQTGSISSAPRELALYGLGDDLAEDGILLGQFVYEKELEPTQTWVLESREQPRAGKDERRTSHVRTVSGALIYFSEPRVGESD
ncbi:hypothetical protein NDU88_005711 [Pleurodeles waltl]|uniref:SUN domain-containing protein n=1 Tax=Pleurodeles waltl TaxID=8319 RepID=A0AAV7TC71_PLEWA|nr:hypothetical protein NDU88_005711 [Pleurodeles waltl]